MTKENKKEIVFEYDNYSIPFKSITYFRINTLVDHNKNTCYTLTLSLSNGNDIITNRMSFDKVTKFKENYLNWICFESNLLS